MPLSYPIQDFDSPFGHFDSELSDSDLRHTAYEILIGACRTSGTRPLTYIPQSDRTISQYKVSAAAAAAPSPPPSLQRSLTSSAASKVKKSLGMRSGSKRRLGGGESVGNQGRATVGELIRVQMRVTEQTDSRTRRAILRIAAGQVCLVTRKIERNGNLISFFFLFSFFFFLKIKIDNLL
jgi:hypothetical protein